MISLSIEDLLATMQQMQAELLVTQARVVHAEGFLATTAT